jgi:hypothetical protein
MLRGCNPGCGAVIHPCCMLAEHQQLLVTQSWHVTEWDADIEGGIRQGIRPSTTAALAAAEGVRVVAADAQDRDRRQLSSSGKCGGWSHHGNCMHVVMHIPFVEKSSALHDIMLLERILV